MFGKVEKLESAVKLSWISDVRFSSVHFLGPVLHSSYYISYLKNEKKYISIFFYFLMCSENQLYVQFLMPSDCSRYYFHLSPLLEKSDPRPSLSSSDKISQAHSHGNLRNISQTFLSKKLGLKKELPKSCWLISKKVETVACCQQYHLLPISPLLWQVNKGPSRTKADVFWVK